MDWSSLALQPSPPAQARQAPAGSLSPLSHPPHFLQPAMNRWVEGRSWGRGETSWLQAGSLGSCGQAQSPPTPTQQASICWVWVGALSHGALCKAPSVTEGACTAVSVQCEVTANFYSKSKVETLLFYTVGSRHSVILCSNL